MASKKKKKTSWYAYGGSPTKMSNLIPLAAYGSNPLQQMGAIGDTNIASKIPGPVGFGIDAALDLAGYFGDKQAYKNMDESSEGAGEYLNAVKKGTNKDTLSFNDSISGAQGVVDNFNSMEKPNFMKDFLAPKLLDTASLIGGGVAKGAGNDLMKGAMDKMNTISSTEQGTKLPIDLLHSMGVQGPARADGTYEMGGVPQENIYEAEGGEVIQHEAGAPPGTTGEMEPIGNNPMLSELKGNSHASGGELVDSEADQIVFSKKLKSDVWGTSFAEAAKKIGTKIEKFQKAAVNGDHITKSTAQSMIQSWNVKLQELQSEQEKARENKFMEMLNDGAALEELQQNFPDLTQKFMQKNSGGPQQEEEIPMSSVESELLYGGKPMKYEYGSPDPNEPPFFSGDRTDEEVPAMQSNFLTYGDGDDSFKIYGEDKGIKNYINSIGMEEFGNQWMANMDPDILSSSGITNFADLKDGNKLIAAQKAYNAKHANDADFTPIPVDAEGQGKFGEHSMSMANMPELENSATNMNTETGLREDGSVIGEPFTKEQMESQVVEMRQENPTTLDPVGMSPLDSSTPTPTPTGNIGDIPDSTISNDRYPFDLKNVFRNRERNIDIGEGGELFPPPTDQDMGGGNGGFFRNQRKLKKQYEEGLGNTDKKIKESEEIIESDSSTIKSKTDAFMGKKLFGNMSKYMSPLYNSLKATEGAEVEPEQTNPYEDQIIQDMDQKTDIQPWLNQNMMSLQGGMDFTKDMASGNPMQMFSMYNRLNQGKMTQDSAAWKYKHDSEGKVKTAKSNMMYNLGERDRLEGGRVSDINSQNRAARDKHLSTAIEQLSAIGQLDEYTSNLMANDGMRMKFLEMMAPDLDKYMQENEGMTEEEAMSIILSQYSSEEIRSMATQ